MAAPSPASLRDLYVPPSNAWSFVPPALAQENSSAAANPPLSAPSASANQWATRTAPSNPLFDLGSSLAGDDSGLDVASLAKELLASLLLQYATNALAQPWEVGKTLLQVQWVPRDAGDAVHDGAEMVDDEAELSDSSNDDSYFADPSAEKPPKPLRAADEQGYIIRQSVLEEGTQPDYVIPVGSAAPLDLVRTRLIVQSSVPRHRTYSGPLDALRQILAHEGGLRGVYLHPHLLIPTLLDSTLHALVPLTLPGLVAAQLGLGAHLAPETHPVQWNVAELLGGVLGSLVLLPFETVRRRLQVQTRGTARPIRACVELRPAPYNGMVDAFWHILTEERSDLPLKPHRRHRRRRSEAGKGKARADAQAEDEDEDAAGESESWWRHTGVGQLYRGLGMRVGASVVVFVLALVGSPDESNGGWAEL
ncbi:mitochondrial carrier [Trametes sanguinea]|nr:mitochondrial carrier [Trametes sanguinea]